MNVTTKQFISIGRDAVFTALMSLVVIFPITGIILDGFQFQLDWARPLKLAAYVLIGRLIWLFGKQLFLAETFDSIKLSIKKRVPAPHLSPGLSRIVTGVVLIALCTFPFMASKYWLSVMIPCLIYVLLALGLNIVVGLAGLLDLGFIAFYAVGAYGFALGHEYLGMNFWMALPFSALVAAVFGAILGFPVLRMHGDYLAIVTLGFGEIIRLVLNNWSDFTGGPNGVSAPGITLFGVEFSRRAKEGGTPFHELFNLEYSSATKYIVIYFIALILCLMLVKFIGRLKVMPIGRAWEALREDEIACRSMGVNHVTTKLSAFSLGAMSGGLAGVVYAAFQGFVSPTSFTFFESALVLAIVVLGGMGSIWGVVIAAVFLTMLPELLREFKSFRVLLFGLLMVIMMIVRPEGLIRNRRAHFKVGRS